MKQQWCTMVCSARQPAVTSTSFLSCPFRRAFFISFPFIELTVTLQLHLIRTQAELGWSNLAIFIESGSGNWTKWFSFPSPLFSPHSFLFLFFSFSQTGSITPNRTWLWRDYSRSTEIALSCHFYSISSSGFKRLHRTRENYTWSCFKHTQLLANKCYSQQISCNCHKWLLPSLHLLSPSAEIIKFETLLKELILNIFLKWQIHKSESIWRLAVQPGSRISYLGSFFCLSFLSL